MPYTGQIGTFSSQLGNVILGYTSTTGTTGKTGRTFTIQASGTLSGVSIDDQVSAGTGTGGYFRLWCAIRNTTYVEFGIPVQIGLNVLVAYGLNDGDGTQEFFGGPGSFYPGKCYIAVQTGMVLPTSLNGYDQGITIGEVAAPSGGGWNDGTVTGTWNVSIDVDEYFQDVFVYTSDGIPQFPQNTLTWSDTGGTWTVTNDGGEIQEGPYQTTHLRYLKPRIGGVATASVSFYGITVTRSDTIGADAAAFYTANCWAAPYAVPYAKGYTSSHYIKGSITSPYNVAIEIPPSCPVTYKSGSFSQTSIPGDNAFPGPIGDITYDTTSGGIDVTVQSISYLDNYGVSQLSRTGAAISLNRYLDTSWQFTGRVRDVDGNLVNGPATLISGPNFTLNADGSLALGDPRLYTDASGNYSLAQTVQQYWADIQFGTVNLNDGSAIAQTFNTPQTEGGAFSPSGIPVSFHLDLPWLRAQGESLNWRILGLGKPFNSFTLQHNATTVFHDCQSLTGWTAGANTTLSLAGGGVQIAVSGGSGSVTLLPTVTDWSGYRYVQFSVKSTINASAPFTVQVPGASHVRMWTKTTGAAGTVVNVQIDLCGPPNAILTTDGKNSRFPLDSQDTDGWGVQNCGTITISGLTSGETYVFTNIEGIRTTFAKGDLVGSPVVRFKDSTARECLSHLFASVDYKDSLEPFYWQAATYPLPTSWPWEQQTLSQLISQINAMAGWTATALPDLIGDGVHNNSNGIAAWAWGFGAVWNGTAWQDAYDKDLTSALTVIAQDLFDTLQVWNGCTDPFFNTGGAVPFYFTKILRAANRGLVMSVTNSSPVSGATVDTTEVGTGANSGTATTDSIGGYTTETPWGKDNIQHVVSVPANNVQLTESWEGRRRNRAWLRGQHIGNGPFNIETKRAQFMRVGVENDTITFFRANYWQPPFVMSVEVTYPPTGYKDSEPRLAVDYDDYTLHILFTRTKTADGSTDVYEICSADGGQTWGGTVGTAPFVLTMNGNLNGSAPSPNLTYGQNIPYSGSYYDGYWGGGTTGAGVFGPEQVVFAGCKHPDIVTGIRGDILRSAYETASGTIQAALKPSGQSSQLAQYALSGIVPADDQYRISQHPFAPFSWYLHLHSGASTGLYSSRDAITWSVVSGPGIASGTRPMLSIGVSGMMVLSALVGTSIDAQVMMPGQGAAQSVFTLYTGPVEDFEWGLSQSPWANNAWMLSINNQGATDESDYVSNGPMDLTHWTLLP